MTFKAYPVNVVGDSKPHRAKSQTSARTLNLFPEISSTGETGQSLLAWPGALNYSFQSGVNDRGMWVNRKTGILYKVTDNTLYEVSQETGAQTSLGTITGTGPVVMSDDGTNLLIATGGDAYQWNGTTLTEVLGSEGEPGASVDVLNNLTIWQGAGNRFGVSDAGNPSSIQSNNYGSAETIGDDLLRVIVFKQNLYLFGSASLEVHYLTDTNEPPFQLIQNSVQPIGIASTFAVCKNENYIYWLSGDKRLYRASAYQPQKVTNAQIGYEFDQYVVSDCRLYSVKFSGQNFVVMLFPLQNKSWVYSEDTGAFFEIAYGANEDITIMSSFANAYGRLLIASRFDGNIYEWDLDTFTDIGEPIVRERIIDPISRSSIGVFRDSLRMSRFELEIEKGVGNATGKGVNPIIMMSASYDQGKSFTNEVWIRTGRKGEAREVVKYDNMATFYNLAIKIRTTDPNFVAIHGGYIHLQRAGR